MTMNIRKQRTFENHINYNIKITKHNIYAKLCGQHPGNQFGYNVLRVQIRTEMKTKQSRRLGKFGLGAGCSWAPGLTIQLIVRHDPRERPYFAFRGFIQRLHEGFAQSRASQTPRAVRGKWHPGGQGRPGTPPAAKPRERASGRQRRPRLQEPGARGLWEKATHPQHLGPETVIQRQSGKAGGINSTHQTRTHNIVSALGDRP